MQPTATPSKLQLALPALAAALIAMAIGAVAPATAQDEPKPEPSEHLVGAERRPGAETAEAEASLSLSTVF